MNFSVFLSLICTPGWVEKETYYWSMEHLCSNPLHLPLISSPCHSIPGKTHLQMPCPLKDKNSFEAIFITTAPKIKNSKCTFTTFYIDPAPLSPISYDTLCMCSLTAVYINQYIYQTAAAYCVCRFEWAKDTNGVSMLCKKGPSSSFPSLLFPCSLPLVFLHTFVLLSSLLANPLLVLQSHTDIKITQWDPTADTTLTATSRLRLLSVEDQWSGHFQIVLTASTSLLFRSWQPQCCCFLICGVWGGFNNFTCLFYF